MKVVNDALWKGLQILYFRLMILDKMRGDSLWKLSMMLYEKGYRFFTLG